MTFRFAPFALVLAASALTPAAAQETAAEPSPLTLQQSGALRCSAAFALGAAAQARGEQTGWPPLAERGREFMVRASASVMDDTGRSRDAVAAAIREYARGLASDPAALPAAMPACLLLLDASGL